MGSGFLRGETSPIERRSPPYLSTTSHPARYRPNSGLIGLGNQNIDADMVANACVLHLALD
jgi:hypothetical protein